MTKQQKVGDFTTVPANNSTLQCWRGSALGAFFSTLAAAVVLAILANGLDSRPAREGRGSVQVLDMAGAGAAINGQHQVLSPAEETPARPMRRLLAHTEKPVSSSLGTGTVSWSSNATGTMCTFKPATFRPMPSTMLASYPGSGSTMTRMLLEVASGVLTGSIYGDDSLFKAKPYPFRGEKTTQNVIGIKTHGPWTNHNTIPRVKKAVIFVRNPSSALPSYFNYDWGVRHRDGHGRQAPEQDWNRFRDRTFRAEFGQWMKHLSFWMAKKPPPHVVIYEELVNPARGPTILASLLAFLNVSVSAQHVVCAWEHVVHLKSMSRSIHREHKYKPQLTPSQRCQLASRLQSLADKYRAHPTLGPALRSWIPACPESLRAALDRPALAAGEGGTGAGGRKGGSRTRGGGGGGNGGEEAAGVEAGKVEAGKP